MGLFFKKKAKQDIHFEKTPEQEGFSLENQDGKLRNITDIDVKNYLDKMFVSSDQFVVLVSPKTQNNVRFVQACIVNNQIEVELSIEESQAHLYYKYCSKEECYRIFLDFYHNRLIPNMKEYKPVQFR